MSLDTAGVSDRCWPSLFSNIFICCKTSATKLCIFKTETWLQLVDPAQTLHKHLLLCTQHTSCCCDAVCTLWMFISDAACPALFPLGSSPAVHLRKENDVVVASTDGKTVILRSRFQPGHDLLNFWPITYCHNYSQLFSHSFAPRLCFFFFFFFALTHINSPVISDPATSPCPAIPHHLTSPPARSALLYTLCTTCISTRTLPDVYCASALFVLPACSPCLTSGPLRDPFWITLLVLICVPGFDICSFFDHEKTFIFYSCLSLRHQPCFSTEPLQLTILLYNCSF